MNFAFISLLTLLLFNGCNTKNELDTINPELARYDSPKELLSKYYEILYSWSQLEDNAYFYRINRAEILNNLEIVELVEKENVAIAFIRYSVGTKIFRDAIWLRKVENKYWYIISYVSKYTAEDDSYLKDKMEWVEEMLEKENNWEENSAEKW